MECYDTIWYKISSRSGPWASSLAPNNNWNYRGQTPRKWLSPSWGLNLTVLGRCSTHRVALCIRTLSYMLSSPGNPPPTDYYYLQPDLHTHKWPLDNHSGLCSYGTFWGCDEGCLLWPTICHIPIHSSTWHSCSPRRLQRCLRHQRQRVRHCKSIRPSTSVPVQHHRSSGY